MEQEIGCPDEERKCEETSGEIASGGRKPPHERAVLGAIKNCGLISAVVHGRIRAVCQRSALVIGCLPIYLRRLVSAFLTMFL